MDCVLHCPVWEKICNMDQKRHALDKLNAGIPENRDTNQHRPEPACFDNSYKPRGCQWYAPLTAIYYINMLTFYVHVYYLLKSLFCSSNLDLYHKLGNKRDEDDVQCCHLTSRWKYMHIKWLSQCQRAFAAVPGAGRRTFNVLKQTFSSFSEQ